MARIRLYVPLSRASVNLSCARVSQQGRCISRAPFTRFVMQQHAMAPSQLITATLDIRDKVNVLVAEMLETKNAQMELLELQELVAELLRT